MRSLVIEDDEANRKLLEIFLRPFGHCESAMDGDEGLEKFKRGLNNNQPFDLICLDIMMPGVGGIEVLRRLREEEAERELYLDNQAKVIMITAVSDKEVVIDAFRVGCEAYLIKPLNRDDLLQQLKVLNLIDLP